MNYRILLLFSLLIALSLGTDAQGTVERAKRRTQQRANNQIDRKIDQEIDKAFNALFSKKKEAEATEAEAGDPNPEEQEAANAVVGMLMGGNDDFTPFQNERPFSVLMTVTEDKRGKSDESRIRIGATTDKIGMITEGDAGSTAHMIFDTQDGKTTMITTDKRGDRSAYRMRMPNLGKLIDESRQDVTDHLEIERTGEHRTIDGYDCELIIVTNTEEQTTTRSWITNDVDLSAMEVFGTMSRMLGGKQQPGAGQMGLPPGMAELVEGFPIESTTVDGNKTFTMRMSEIKTGGDIDLSLFEVGDVEVQDMGF
ncbi:uncharacterized protein DUF4412 [Neolewinella xylanilytica]|uniref:Uncharacterized protein DUF4412 n=1 Tax=Neolewinella xylanilytica TaxID=1514080 RepID=A0A2S6I285_9BACT|nr:DUF4412 domain-containing protein [Neolewinella xylanilytica]PPK85278.1 uncharacterized protein DUF4412 [Neolewinella xylanilytica]